VNVAQWGQLLISGLTSGAIYGLIGLGYVTIYRTSRVVNMAQGSFVMLGALFAWSAVNELKWPFWLGILVTIVAITVLSVVMYRLVIAPVMKVSLVAMILATIGVSLICENAALIHWGGYGQSPPPLTKGSFHAGGVIVQWQSIWIFAITGLVLLGLYLLGNHTFLGKRMTATASNPDAASICGVWTGRMVLVAFGISGAVAAVSGIAISSIAPVSFVSGGAFGLMGFVAAILGGWGSSAGAVVGGLVLGLIEGVVVGLLPAGYKGAVAFVLLLLILYFRPTGILGKTVPEGEQ
jgi:branched-chain amino acid transport system permease protein